MNTFGTVVGEVCWRNGCQGIICERIKGSDEGCSCHISPPCGYCTTPREVCPECDWRMATDFTFNDLSIRGDDAKMGWYNEKWHTVEPRPLDPRKLDYRNMSHTNASMIKEGVYPPGMTQEDVRKAIDGTFGGRFAYFGDGKFKFIAYTD